MGGLGNVLFQVNFAYRLLEIGYRVRLNCFMLERGVIVNSFLKQSNHGILGDLNLLKIYNDFHVCRELVPQHFYGYISKRINSVFFNTLYYGLSTPSLTSDLPNYLCGYFHLQNAVSSNLVVKIQNAIHSLLGDINYQYLKDIVGETQNEVVVHFRGGDYIDQKEFGVDLEYYRRALIGVNRCIVVTNDRKNACAYLNKLGVVYKFVETRSALDDFILLMFAKRKVLASSTFSWWASEVGCDDCVIFQREPFYQHTNWNPETKKRREIISVK